MIYQNKRLDQHVFQKKDFKFYGLRSNKLYVLSILASSADGDYKVVGPTILVEWANEDSTS